MISGFAVFHCNNKQGKKKTQKNIIFFKNTFIKKISPSRFTGLCIFVSISNLTLSCDGSSSPPWFSGTWAMWEDGFWGKKKFLSMLLFPMIAVTAFPVLLTKEGHLFFNSLSGILHKSSHYSSNSLPNSVPAALPFLTLSLHIQAVSLYSHSPGPIMWVFPFYTLVWPKSPSWAVLVSASVSQIFTCQIWELLHLRKMPLKSCWFGFPPFSPRAVYSQGIPSTNY